jgi:hypothetical protein
LIYLKAEMKLIFIMKNMQEDMLMTRKMIALAGVFLVAGARPHDE